MPRRKKLRPEDEPVIAMAAAYLRSQGSKQREISERLRVSQPEISRLLQIALDEKWLSPPVFSARSAPEIWKAARARFFQLPDVEKRLRNLSQSTERRLQRVTFVPSEKDQDNFDAFSAQIVDVIAERFSGVQTVGVTWGRTLSRLAAVLADHRDRLPRREKPIQFVPLCGEPLKDRIDPVSFSSSALAAKLSEIFNGPGYAPPPSLAGVPIFIPLQFNNNKTITEEEVTTIRRFICEVAGYADVFGADASLPESAPKEGPLVDRVELILTSVGIVPGEAELSESSVRRGTFLQERVQLGDLSVADLEQSVAGDIGGVIIGHQDIPQDMQDRIEKMNGRWTGIQMKHLVRCASAASRTKNAGVVVVATGKKRRQIVERCVQLDLVTELIIDQELEKELLQK